MDYTNCVLDDQKIIAQLDSVELSDKKRKKLVRALPKGISLFQARLVASVLSERFIGGICWTTNPKNTQVLSLASIRTQRKKLINVLKLKKRGASFLEILQEVAKYK